MAKAEKDLLGQACHRSDVGTVGFRRGAVDLCSEVASVNQARINSQTRYQLVEEDDRSSLVVYLRLHVTKSDLRVVLLEKKKRTSADSQERSSLIGKN